MDGFKNIEHKLHQFTRKFYTNELIKGAIFFFTLGGLYFFFTLFLEYFLWLKPGLRTLLFWIFIVIELYLLVRFIVIPIFKLIGLRGGISLSEASSIIGNHFPDVSDKLLNVIQLHDSKEQTELILASIQQKSQELQPIPFVRAIDFSNNKKYIKYALVPIVIYVISILTISSGGLSESLERVVNHRTAYVPPAPFSFSLLNSDLKVIQGTSLLISLKTLGDVVPSEAKIVFNNQEYFMQKNGYTTFEYLFSDIQQPFSFFAESNGVQSQEYVVQVIKTPRIQNVVLELNYPKYLRRENERIQNTGNIVVPEGTLVNWKVQTSQTDTLMFSIGKEDFVFNKLEEDVFEYKKRVRRAFNYQISSSNENLTNYENLLFSMDIVKDQYPLIAVSSNMDSISRGTVQFAGQISDDYGLNKLQLVYYNLENPNDSQELEIPIEKQMLQTFFYDFPDGLMLEKGVDYEFYFQVFDNDAVNGNKKTKSRSFSYRQKTEKEVEEELLEEQKNTINDLENTIQKQSKQQKQLQEIQQDFQNKKSMNWNDKKKVENFLKRQEQYKNMMQRQTDMLQQNLEEKEEENPSLQEKKEDLKERINELRKLDKQQKLLDEIQKMADKLNKEDLVKKAKELAQQNKQQQRSLEKTLEMVKRFYVEQKTMQIANKIEDLAKEQENISKQNDSLLAPQKAVKKKFDEIKKELQELEKDNQKLKDPMELPDVDNEKESIEDELKKAEENIKNKDAARTKQSQKNSSKKMKEMSAKMQQAMMEMQGESMEENIDDLRKILENLVLFSFEQEQLMNRFSERSTSHPEFGNDLKRQNIMKAYFEHIDDSLYVLSMRVPKISTKIQDDLAAVHYNLGESLENFTENRFYQGVSNQRYVMTATNNLSDYLSNILNSMQNNMSMKMGKGKKGKGQGFSLPDLIKKQEGLSQKMKDGLKKGKEKGQGKEGGKPDNEGKSGSKGKDGKGSEPGENGKKKGQGEGGAIDDMEGELYEIFKQQSQLRQELQNAIKESEGRGSGNQRAKKVLKTMQELENEILEKGFNVGTLQKMQQLNYELLKLEKAALEQGKDEKRKSKFNKKETQRNKIKALEFKKRFYNQIEILNRQSLPLRENYKKKVREYFSDKKLN